MLDRDVEQLHSWGLPEEKFHRGILCGVGGF